MKRTWIEKQPEEMPPSARRVIAISDGYVTHSTVAGAAKVKSVIADYVRTYDFNGGDPHSLTWQAEVWEHDRLQWLLREVVNFHPVRHMSSKLYQELTAAHERGNNENL